MAVSDKQVRETLSGISLSGQMHGLVCLDKDHHILRPAILWNDQRTAAQCSQITERIDTSTLIELTGNSALTGFTAPKLLWLREHEPDCYKKIAHILLPKDYIRYRLSGELATDLSDASGTLLLDVKNRRWSERVLDALEIPAAWLPQLSEGTEISGRISAEAAEATGLPKRTAIATGGGDQAAQAVGVGAVKPGINALTIGTSGVVFAPLDEYRYDSTGSLHAFCHAVPNTWHIMGVMLSAAGSLSWVRDSLFPTEDFDKLVHSAASAAAGCGGLFFLPYLTGERTPHADPLARGAFIGLTARHGKQELVRSVMEGVAFGLRDCFDLLQSCLPEGQSSELRVSGGGSKNRAWLQIVADILDQPLKTVSTSEGAAYGAALIAGVGAGVWSDVHEATAACVRVKDTIAPGVNRGKYQELHAVYKSLYPLLRDTFPRL
jgi:xylulokinase